MIGASAGGVMAIHRILQSLNPSFTSPVIVIQHLPDLKHVDVKTVYPAGPGRIVLEIEDKMPIEPNHVYFAPGGYHLEFDQDESFILSQDEPVRFSRPSIDLSFESAARVFGPRLTAIVLTGANGDGAQGLRSIQNAGGRCIIQNPENADYREMPLAALALVKPDHLVQIDEISPLLAKIESAR